MKKIALASTLALALAGFAGCQQDNRNLEKKIDDLTAKVNDLQTSMKQVAAGRTNLVVDLENETWATHSELLIGCCGDRTRP